MEGITNELIINALSQDTESINNEFMAQVSSSGMESMIIKALLPVIAIMVVIVAINYILSAIGYVKIFQKANIDNPIANGMIPLWNTFTAFQMTDNLNMFWILIGVSVVSSVISTIPVISSLTIVGSISALYIVILQEHKLSKAFGHGAGYTVGLVLLRPIFMLILGCGSSQYEE
jgi:hypothetical protein